MAYMERLGSVFRFSMSMCFSAFFIGPGGLAPLTPLAPSAPEECADLLLVQWLGPW